MQAVDTIEKTFKQFGIDHLGNWSNFLKLGEIKPYKKGSILKEAHQVEKHLNIIIEGAATSSIWDDQNNPKCLDLFFDHQFVTDYHSFINQIPTPIENQLLCDSIIFSISYKAFIKLINSSPNGNKITRVITDFHFSHKQKQQIDLLTKSSTERFTDLLVSMPGLLDRIPKKNIASYLGITPQSLSRIIKNMS